MTFIANRNSMCQILILILVTIASQGTPIRPCRNISQILAEPCGGCRPVRASGARCQPSNNFEDIAPKAHGAKRRCQKLKTKYNSEPKIRISDDYMASLAGQNWSEYQFPNTQQNITMEEYYDDISVITIFVDIAYRQESSKNYTRDMNDVTNAPQQGSSGDYKSDMMVIRNKLEHLLCSIHIATCSNSANILASMNLAKYPFVVNSTAERYERDFIVFRDAFDYLKSTTITTT